MDNFNKSTDKDQSKNMEDLFQHNYGDQQLPPPQQPQQERTKTINDSYNNYTSTMEAEEKDEEIDKSWIPAIKAIQNRKTNYIFLFGRPGSGKTAIISSLCHYMGTHPSGSLEVRNRNNKEGIFLLKEIFKKGREGLFLERTARNKITEIDLKYTPRKPKKPVNLTFLEMSGEDLNKVELERDYVTGDPTGGNLPDNIDIYLKSPKVKMLFLLVTEQGRAREDDLFMFEFLDYLRKKHKNFIKPKVLLLVSKWDQYNGRYKDDISSFVAKHMKLTYNFLTQIDGSIGYYSVGDVIEIPKGPTTETVIANVNQQQADVVKRWMYQNITGKTIPVKGTSWWEKMMRNLGN